MKKLNMIVGVAVAIGVLIIIANAVAPEYERLKQTQEIKNLPPDFKFLLDQLHVSKPTQLQIDAKVGAANLGRSVNDQSGEVDYLTLVLPLIYEADYSPFYKHTVNFEVADMKSSLTTLAIGNNCKAMEQADGLMNHDMKLMIARELMMKHARCEPIEK